MISALTIILSCYDDFACNCFMITPVSLLEVITYLLQRVGGDGTVAALRLLGSVVAEVFTDAVPQILCGQRRL